MEHLAFVGIKPSEMYDMTPLEIENYANGRIRRYEMEYEIAITNAWLSAGLERQKRLPRLDELIKRKEKEIQNDKQMLAMVKALNDALGGEVVET
jgi:hypothetical protein